MKTRTSLFAICITLAAPAAADAQVRLDATIGAKNQYALSMAGLNVYDKPVLQTSLWWTLPHGFWFNTWADSAMTFEPGFNRELDNGLGWMNENLMVGVYYYDLYEQFSMEADGDIVEPLIQAWYDWEVAKGHTIKPYGQANYFFATKDPGEKNATLSHGGVQHLWDGALGIEAAHLKQEISTVYDSGIFGNDHGIIGRYGAYATIRFTDALAIGVPFQFTTPLSSSLRDREPEATYGLDLIISHVFVEPPEETNP